MIPIAARRHTVAERAPPERSPSVTRLHELVATLPEVVTRAAGAPARPPQRPGAVRRWLITGGGLAEGPAQALAQTLAEDAQLDARFVPQSAFVGADPRWRDAGLIVFSQGTSPNGQLAMARAGHFAAAWLVTARAADHPEVERWLAAGHGVVWHPAAPSDGSLIRIWGPAAAIVAAWQLAGRLPGTPATVRAGWEAAVERAADHVRESQRRARGLVDRLPAAVWRQPIALLTQGPWRDALQAAAWCWLEGAWRPVPPIWDVLQIAHGPMQERWREPTTWVHFQRADDPAGDALHQRIRAIFDGTAHRVVQLPVCAGPAAVLEALAATQLLMLAALDGTPRRDLAAWPGKGRDQPIYGYTARDAPAPDELPGASAGSGAPESP